MSILNSYFIYNSYITINASTVISALLSFSLLLKAAQFVFFPWLLDAMEAPVPISSQLHSSTLVIIGFYVFYRLEGIISISNFIKKVYFYFSFFTIITATFLGFFQDDGKRLLACSTASQLGYVILSISLDLIRESQLLLVFVCCNKAFTFVWLGVVMDKNGGVSDIRIYKNKILNSLEKFGLVFSFLNSTIIIGSVNWHIKGLLTKGLLVLDNSYLIFGLEVISLTWFFSSIYLLKLFLGLFSFTKKGVNDDTKLYNYLGFFLKNKINSKYFFFWAVVLIVALTISPIFKFWIILFH